MKKISISSLIVLISTFFVACNGDTVEPKIEGCTDSTAENYNPEANVDCNCCIRDGSILFWTGDKIALFNCAQNITVKLNNGQQTNITGYWFFAPPDCDSTNGGYFKVKEGTYTYNTSTENGCFISQGTVKVEANTCNYVEVKN